MDFQRKNQFDLLLKQVETVESIFAGSCQKISIDPQLRNLMKDNLKVEIWNDPVWGPALQSLETVGDSEQLSKLLRAGTQTPTHVLERLGIMLCPPDGYAGPFFKVTFPKRSRQNAMQKLLKDREIRDLIRLALQEFGNNLEAAMSSVKQKTRLSRAKLFQC